MLASGSADETVRIWALPPEAGGPRSPYSRPSSFAAVPPRRGGARLALWREVHVLRGHRGAVLGVAFSDDGSLLVSASADKTLKIWRTDRGLSRTALLGHTDEVCACAFNGDASRAFSAARDNTVRVWSTVSGACLSVLRGHLDAVRCLAISLDQSFLVTGSLDRDLKARPPRPAPPRFPFDFRSDFHSLLFAVWRAAVREEDARGGAGAEEAYGATAVAVSPDGPAHAADAAEAALQLLPYHTAPVYAVALSPDRSRCATGGADRAAKARPAPPSPAPPRP
eukprot:tig00000254_g22481.t1